MRSANASHAWHAFKTRSGAGTRAYLRFRSRFAEADDLLAGPIRGELLGPEHLAERARELTRNQRVQAPRKSVPRWGTPAGLSRLEGTRRIVTSARDYLSANAHADVGPAGDWLLDNFYLIDRFLRAVREGLPKGYYRELPVLSAGPLTGEPRVFELAITLVAHTEGRVERANLELFIAAVQEVSPLNLGELWALPAMMQLALIENIRRMTLRTVHRLEELEDADDWAARIEAASEQGQRELRATLDSFLLRPRPLTPAFVSRLLHQLRVTSSSSPPLAKLERWIAEEELSAEDASARASQQLALTQMMMANSITSLRALAELDWVSLIERQSATEAVLRRDPSGHYPAMTAATRDAYRHHVERIARRSPSTEVEVASAAVAMARESSGRRGHVGYFLLDRGRAQLEQELAYRPGVRERCGRFVARHPHLPFLGGIFVASVALLALLMSRGEGRSALCIGLLALLPVLDFAIHAVNQLITVAVAPQRLPKLEIKPDAAGAEIQTALVVPILLTSVKTVSDALHNLEVQYLSNPQPYLRFVLLGDFADAAHETEPGDAAIVEAADAGVRALNERHGGHGPFHLLHRPRRFDREQGCWMGWERKRGKLAQLNAYLRGDPAPSFSHQVGDGPRLRETRFVITLDADTMLPAEAAAQLIGTLAHPLNRPVFDDATHTVIDGHGVLQPRVEVSLPSAQGSAFASLMSGRPGVDPYTTASSDLYQDLYGEGSFSGKGIYDVDAFVRATRGRFPEGRLLSHDLIEGCFMRAGLVTDVSVYDDYPARHTTHTRRKHRWIRGDWQLLPWLGRTIPGPARDTPSPLSLLSRFKIFDNLRRSVSELAQLVLLVAGWTVLPGSAAAWTAITLALIAGPWWLSVLLAVLRPPFDRSLAAYYASVGRDAWSALKQYGLAIVFLPHHAWNALDAIGRTLWRLYVSHRHLLEWKTAAQSERSGSGTLDEAWRMMAPATLAAATGVLWLGLRRLHGLDVLALGSVLDLLAVLAFAPLWLSAPLVAHRLGLPVVRRRAQPSPAQAETMFRHAKLHWQFFAQFTNESSGWLSPDNVQDEETRVVAMRTSPTNIGLQLLSTVTAHDLGLITREHMLTRLEAAFGTIEALPKYEGHLYNWYSLETFAVLEPAYVSTVDSGNLAGHCIALRQACLELAQDGREPALVERLHQLAARAYRLYDEMNFRFLYDEQRKLFVIGYQPATNSKDGSYYDLLASESRLASFVAVAKSEVPVEHWFRLGRALTRGNGGTALVSWSGSMFEYLMPMLVMRSYAGTLLDQTHQGAVRRQISHGRSLGLPWGVSESAYNVRDRHMTYQYRAFGVPGLALKRGLENERVVAPYATLLALMVDPKHALANLERLEKLGVGGPFGLRDAIDYTRPLPGQDLALVNTYMAHHIGMGLVALGNELLAEIWPRRFHADALVRSAELLLQERVPWAITVVDRQPSTPEKQLLEADAAQDGTRTFESHDIAEPHVALLGQLPYTLMISHAGAGYSRYADVAVTRFRADGTTDNTGQFCYVKDVTSGRLWSTAHQPVCAPADAYRAVLAADRVSFQRRDDGIETHTEIAVVPEDAAEIRRVTLTNHSNEPRILELTSYGEIVLAPPDADRAHPAFSNLFVETEWHEWCSAITAVRRPRSAKERTLVCVHVVASDAPDVSYETDRARFVGRGRSTRDPAALERDGLLDGSTGAVLDPIFALRVRVALQPGQSAQVAFTTLVAETRDAAFVLADRYRHPQAAQRALGLSWTATQVELRELGVSHAEAAVFQELAGALFYATPALRAPADELNRNRGSQPLLWEQGISGDWPIVLASIDARDGIATLLRLFAAHHYWRRRGMAVDLVVLNTHPSLYLQELAHEITAGLYGSSDSGMLDRPGGVFVLRRDLLAPPVLAMLRATARVHVLCDGLPLGRSVVKSEAKPPAPMRTATPTRAPQQARRRSPASTWATELSEQVLRAPRVLGEVAQGEPGEPLLLDNGLGGLTARGSYQIRVGAELPPAPWANVIANPHGGFVVSERGGGFSWAESSYFFRLTPWHNDPVGDPPGEVLYVRDEDSGDVWSATPAPVAHGDPFTVEHGAGWSSFVHTHEGIASQLTLGLADDAPVKISRLRLTNLGEKPRSLSVTAYVEWTLGVLREHTQHQVRTQFDSAARAILARNYFDPQFASWVAFCASSEVISSYSGSRRSFIGRNGTLAAPAALYERELDRRTGAGIDPCAALRCPVTLAPGESYELAFVLGAAASEHEARSAIERFCTVEHASATLAHSADAWSQRLHTIQVCTPDPAFDVMLNGWTLYQTLACRMWARSALYQSSGAYGFRDQLQDTMALVYAEPGLARAHILRAASRQFPEGDVQHWWHEGTGRGVRTRFSDDLAWLPYVVAHYLRVTGDLGVLEESVHFLAMPLLGPDQHEVYAEPHVSSEAATLYEHCLRALHKACTTGAHGLPLMGGGDWNDGMNLVGAEGRGESVWLAWFLISGLRAFEPHVRVRDEAAAEELLRRARDYAAAADSEAWDGAWYRRAYFDDGSPLGSASSDECKIDSIAQSWSVISGAGAHQAQAMQSLAEHLLDEPAKLVLLLTPPFDKSARDPGYIKGYLPGVRENGAQYTHAALWTVLAFALRGDGDRAFELYQMINPLSHARTPAEVAVYKVEPYVVAADVYAAEGQRGRGGWTWYTGSASWMYRVGLESILGFQKRGDVLHLTPAVPAAWPGFRITYRHGQSEYTIEVRLQDEGNERLELDGVVLEGSGIPLSDDGKPHRVVAHLARRTRSV
jgi:cyclic beta-1,2-glucan synthetase